MLLLNKNRVKYDYLVDVLYQNNSRIDVLALLFSETRAYFSIVYMTKELKFIYIGLLYNFKPQHMNIKLRSILGVLLLSMVQLQAQSPNQMNYQAVVRNSSGQPVGVGTPVKLRFNIHDQTASGSVVYTETINDTANQFGLVSAQIGSVANLSTVNWSTGSKFLEVDAEINNSGNFINMGTSQLLSVPYALFSSNGAPGPQGPTGAQGPSGANGVQGPTGLQGIQGPTGVQGLPGSQGSTGMAGASGNDGAAGTTGAQGLQGIQGATGPQGIQGAQGIAGNTGVQGPVGATGADGAQGASGAQGSQGSTGPQGIQGPAGSTGVDGAQGPTGVQGIQGIAGVTGAAGATGLQGLQGPTGVGIQGPTGNNGAQGVAGVTGATGIGLAGPTGPAGPTGSGGTPTYTPGTTYYVSGTQTYTGPAAGSPGAGTTNSFTVPAGVTVIKAYLVGGGGGGGYNSGNGPSSGSCAGITIGVIDVTPGEVLTVFVGAGGTGLGSGSGSGKGGTGSYITRSGVLLAGAGGGGGGASDGSTSGTAGGIGFSTTFPSNGGNGGSTTGGAGGFNYFGAMRETQAYKGYDDVAQINSGPGTYSSNFTALYNSSVTYGSGGYYGSGDKGAVILMW